jgi:purine-binding chemotaxis protein CheW
MMQLRPAGCRRRTFENSPHRLNGRASRDRTARRCNEFGGVARLKASTGKLEGPSMTSTLRTAGFDGETLETIPHSPPEVIGVMNLRGTVIPIIDLAHKLGMKSTTANERSAIVVAEVHNMVIGLVVDRVSDILTVQGNQVQPVPEVTASFDKSFAEGIIANENGMICFLNLARMFKEREVEEMAA